MRAIWTIYQRELSRRFTSLVAYLVSATFLLLTALVFYEDLTLSVTVRPTSPDAVPSFLTLGMVIFAPILTMQAIAEEKREGTLELLLTAPVTDTAIILGKFLSAWAYFSLLLLITSIYPILLIIIGQQFDIGHAIAAYVGIWLYGGTTLAIGIMFSATTENQIVAAFLSSAALALLFLGNRIGEIIPNISIAATLRQLSLQAHYAGSFAIGVIRFEDIIFFIGATVFALYISTRAIHAQRVA